MDDYDDDTAFAIDEGNESLREYAQSLNDADKEQFLARLKDDEAFAEQMRDALDAVNNLFTLAAVGDDDDFGDARDEMVDDASNREQSIHTLRGFFLEHPEEIDVSVLLGSKDDEQRFAHRIKDTSDRYAHSRAR